MYMPFLPTTSAQIRSAACEYFIFIACACVRVCGGRGVRTRMCMLLFHKSEGILFITLKKCGGHSTN